MMSYAWQHIRYGPLAPFPGTRVREQLKEEGLLTKAANDWSKHNGRPADLTFKFKDKRVKAWNLGNIVEEVKFHYYLREHKTDFPNDYTTLLVAALSTFEKDELTSCLNKFSRMFGEKEGNIIKDYIKTAPSYENNKKFTKYFKENIKYLM
jgi:hypothetical protein